MSGNFTHFAQGAKVRALISLVQILYPHYQTPFTKLKFEPRLRLNKKKYLRKQISNRASLKPKKLVGAKAW